jgi:hypothetical protein
MGPENPKLGPSARLECETGRPWNTRHGGSIRPSPKCCGPLASHQAAEGVRVTELHRRNQYPIAVGRLRCPKTQVSRHLAIRQESARFSAGRTEVLDIRLIDRSIRRARRVCNESRQGI